MPDAAVLLRLVQTLEALCAELRQGLPTPEPEDDLVPLPQAEKEFGRTNITVRRWATKEAMGVLVDGKWYLRRSLVRKYKRA